MKPYIYILIGAALGYLLCSQCHRPDPTGANQARSDTVTVTRTDTVTVTDYVREVHPVYVRDTVIVQAWDTIPTDTAAIVADYLRARYYANTFADSLYTLTIFDTVSANRLAGQGIALEVYQRTIERTVTNTDYQTGLLLGIAAHGPAFGVSGMAGWQFRGTTVVGGYDPLNRQGMAGVMWHIGR
jgi:hypothetical protein